MNLYDLIITSILLVNLPQNENVTHRISFEHREGTYTKLEHCKEKENFMKNILSIVGNVNNIIPIEKRENVKIEKIESIVCKEVLPVINIIEVLPRK